MRRPQTAEIVELRWGVPMGRSQFPAEPSKRCVYCGKAMPAHLAQCPHCREMAPEVRLSGYTTRHSGAAQVRRGLLCMLLAVLIHYFAAGYSPLHVLDLAKINPAVTSYLTSLLFLSGAGLGIYGLYLRVRA